MHRAIVPVAAVLIAGCQQMEPDTAVQAVVQAVATEDAEVVETAEATLPEKPLGFRMGMTRDDIGEVEDRGNGWFRATHVKGRAANRLFDFYELNFSDAEGLCVLEAVGRDVYDTADGAATRREIDMLRQALARTYGQPDFVDLDVAEAGQSLSWLESIRDESREHRFCWREGDYAHDIESICLKAKVLEESDTGYGVIRYEFDNYTTCEAEWDAAALEEL